MPVTPTESTGGTQNVAALSTVYNLLDTTVAGIYELHLDVNPLANEDVLVVRVHESVRSGGTERLIAEVEVPNAQYIKHFKTEPFVLPFGGRFSVEQTNGVVIGNTLIWSIYTW